MLSSGTIVGNVDCWGLTMFDFKAIGEAGKAMSEAAGEMVDQIKYANDHLKMIEAYMAEIHEVVRLYKKSDSMTADELDEAIARDYADK
jgi:hypothetical protein